MIHLHICAIVRPRQKPCLQPQSTKKQKLSSMKTRIVSILTALFGVLFLQEASAQENFLSGSFTTKLNTAYMNKAGVMLYRQPTSVNILDINLGKDWTAEVWSSTHLGKEKYNITSGDEWDFLLMYHHNFFTDFRVLVTGGYMAIKDLRLSGNDFWIAEAELSYTKYNYFMPYICTRYIGKTGTKSPEPGWFGWIGVRGSYPTGFKQARLNLDLCASYSDGALGRTPGLDYGRAVISLPIQLDKNWVLTPSVLLQTPLGDQASHKVAYTRQNEAVGSIALCFKF